VWKMKPTDCGLELESTTTKWTAKLMKGGIVSICPPDSVSIGGQCCQWRLSTEEVEEMVALFEVVALLRSYAEDQSTAGSHYGEEL
jgi:hypothetical protein